MQAAERGSSKHGDRHVSGSMASAMQASAPNRGQDKRQSHRPTERHRGPAKAVAAQDNSSRGHSAQTRANRPEPPQTAARGNGNARALAAAKGARDGVKVLKDGRRYYSQPGARETFGLASARRGLIDGCPPGLARKNNGCQPPGLARQQAYQPGWWGASNVLDGRYVYDDGYLLRLNGGNVAGYLPLLGGALAVGNPWPVNYSPLPVPQYYVDYYDLGPMGSYRYADDVLYRVDPSTSAITAIAALLTGSNFEIGAPIPAGYDVYNVPYGYRDQYVDGPDAWYRYSDGYIYQVDPTTRLVTAAIDLLAS
jgi:hypothetical protein